MKAAQLVQSLLDRIVDLQYDFNSFIEHHAATERAYDVAQAERNALRAEVERWKEMYEIEAEDANQWLKEEAVERKRAEFAEAQVAALRSALETLVAEWREDARQECIDRDGGWVGADAKLRACADELAALLQPEIDR